MSYCLLNDVAYNFRCATAEFITDSWDVVFIISTKSWALGLRQGRPVCTLGDA